GENLLWSSPDVDPAGALQLWMSSPEHRANILTARWRQIGVSAVHYAVAPGTYKGLEVTIITTDFGIRR
ncbi:MAG TPA: CAP domain-containing protein, partial [Gaiellaceae bacterium]